MRHDNAPRAAPNACARIHLLFAFLALEGRQFDAAERARSECLMDAQLVELRRVLGHFVRARLHRHLHSEWRQHFFVVLRNC